MTSHKMRSVLISNKRLVCLSSLAASSLRWSVPQEEGNGRIKGHHMLTQLLLSCNASGRITKTAVPLADQMALVGHND